MVSKIDGVTYRNMIDYAVRNLNAHAKTVNRLNVFPVPDADTGTNMITTIKNGLTAAHDKAASLSEFAHAFADGVVFGARGNSGVILSQFFKALSEQFYNTEEADADALVQGLLKGAKAAREAVGKPVEGTILTVLKDAADAAEHIPPENQSIETVISVFYEEARRSLERTPELLSALKEQGVVDSGGAGAVYLFEGIKKYLSGEEINAEKEEDLPSLSIDYSSFGRDSRFEFGYCTEFLLQLLNDKEPFDRADLRRRLERIGDSIVLSLSEDKVRVHVHTKTPEKALAHGRAYGEFLSVKIENMTVQHSENMNNILTAESCGNGPFAVVAVASDPSEQALLVQMGADAVICAEDKVTAKDYIEAFDRISSSRIVLFANREDHASALQAQALSKDVAIYITQSRCLADCYASLPIIDFEEEDIKKVLGEIRETIARLDTVSLSKRNTPVSYGGNILPHEEYYAFSGKEVLVVNRTLKKAILKTVETVLSRKKKEILTLFYGNTISDDAAKEIEESIRRDFPCLEINTVSTPSLSAILTLSFE